MSDQIITYKGKPLSECSKKELIKACEAAIQTIEDEKKWAKQNYEMNELFKKVGHMFNKPEGESKAKDAVNLTDEGLREVADKTSYETGGAGSDFYPEDRQTLKDAIFELLRQVRDAAREEALEEAAKTAFNKLKKLGVELCIDYAEEIAEDIRSLKKGEKA